MEDKLPHIVFVIHDVEGGVASMNHQIIENGDFGRYFQVHVVLWRTQEDKSKSFRGIFTKVRDLNNFVYSVDDNYYFVLKRLNKLLNNWNGMIVTNDGIELEAIRKFGTGSVLFSIVHDFYNLKLAIENADLVDYFICHTEVFSKALLSSSVLRERVGYLLHGVKVAPVDAVKREMGERRLKIVSVSRLTESKGVLLLAGIDQRLLEKGVEVEWLVIGSGEVEGQLRKQWEGKTNISFRKPDTQEEVYELVSTGDIFISPSYFEGYGIALLEAMSCGLVPVIHRLPVGVYSNLADTIGFSVAPGDMEAMAQSIGRLHADRSLLADMRERARQLIVSQYDILRTSEAFLEYFKENTAARVNRQLQPRQYPSAGILDKPFIPGGISRWVKKNR
ncbi:MAG TPA: glycosyltransferase family 4 protein [Puia sp.]|nr:glycosyltransferase family 4 protein [Puia sp.]